MKKVIILTEGGRGIGFGHITRCSSLYQAFEDYQVSSKMIVNGDNTIIELINGFNYSLVDWITKFDSIKYEIENSYLVIIDSYKASEEFLIKIQSLVSKCIYFDDFNRIKYPKGIIINGAIGAEKLDYSNQSSKLLLGSQYSPLRKVFWSQSNKTINQNIESIMITFGGDDIRNLTPKILNLLGKNFPNIVKNIIIGNSFNNITEIEQNIDPKTNLYYNPTPENLKNIMINSDLAISSGGQTLYELASIGTPSIIISIADNQNSSINSFLEKKLFLFAGDYKNINLMDNVIRLIYKMKDINVRKELYSNLKENINCIGSKNIVNRLLNI